MSLPVLPITSFFIVIEFYLNNSNQQEPVMKKFIKSPSGKTLFQRLEEKHQFPIMIVSNNRSCACCAKRFTRRRQPCAEFHTTPEGLRQPILYLLFLCQVCVAKYHTGECERRKVMEAVEESLAAEISQ